MSVIGTAVFEDIIEIIHHQEAWIPVSRVVMMAIACTVSTSRYPVPGRFSCRLAARLSE